MNAANWIALAALVGAALVGTAKLIWMAAQFFIGMRNDINMILNNHLHSLQEDMKLVKEKLNL